MINIILLTIVATAAIMLNVVLLLYSDEFEDIIWVMIFTSLVWICIWAITLMIKGVI